MIHGPINIRSNNKYLLCVAEIINNLFILLYANFWVIPRSLNFICRRFGTLCLFHLHRQVGMKYEVRLFCNVMGSFMLCSATKYYSIDAIRLDEMGRACGFIWKEMNSEFWWRNLKVNTV